MSAVISHQFLTSSTGATVGSALVDAIATWCDALNGSMSLQQALTCLVIGIGAESGMIVRTQMSDFHPVRIATFDSQAQRAPRPLSASFADGHFGPHIRRPRPASVWLGSALVHDAFSDGDPALADWQESRRLKDFVVLVLAASGTVRDHIELHFPHPISPNVQETIAALLPTMARTWSSRQVGLIARTVINHRLASRPKHQPPANILVLGSANPARLSRAEFRVCLHLSHGLSIAGVAEELSLSDSTVRTHLRNIYAKTDTSGLAELVFLLLRPRRSFAGAEARCA